MRTFLSMSISILLASACSPGFTPFREVEKSRVIGAVVEVDSDPTIATPAPGEAATLRLIVADPGPKQGRTWGIVVCRPGTSQLDAVYCTDAATIVGTSFSPALPSPDAGVPITDPSVSFTVPDAATLGDAKELWVMGAVCNGGTVRDLVSDPPVYGRPWDPCVADPSAAIAPVGQLITTRIKLNRDANSLNHRPDLLTLTFDGIAWTKEPPDDEPTTGCAGLGYPEIVADGGKHRVSATSSATSRETYIPDGLTTSYPEDLFLFVFRSAGDVDPNYGTIDDSSTTATFDYLPPPATEVAPNGTLVRVWLQLTDDRAAATFAPRAICVLPP